MSVPPFIFIPAEFTYYPIYEKLVIKYPKSVYDYNPSEGIDGVLDILWNNYINEDAAIIVISEGELKEQAFANNMSHIIFQEDSDEMIAIIESIIRAQV